MATLTSPNDGYKAFRIWNLTDSAPLVTQIDDDDPAHLQFSADGRWLALRALGTGFILDLEKQTAPTPLGTPDTVAFSPNSQWLVTTSGKAGPAQLWSFRSGWKVALTLTPEVTGAVFSPDGNWLFTGSSEIAQLWKLGNSMQDPLFTLARVKVDPVQSGSTGLTTKAVFSWDSRWLLTADKTGGKLWKLDPKHLPVLAKSFAIGNAPFIGKFSPDSKWLLTTGGSGTQVLNLSKSSASVAWDSPEWFRYSNFSPNSHWLLVMGQLSPYMLDLSTKKPRIASTAYPVPAVFSPDSRRLVSLPNLWELDGSRASGISTSIRLSMPTALFSEVYFSPDGRWIIGRSLSAVSLWSAHAEDLSVLACRTAGRNLSKEEWENYLPGQSYLCTCPQYPPGEGAGAKCPLPASSKAQSADASTTATPVHAKKKTRQ